MEIFSDLVRDLIFINGTIITVLVSVLMTYRLASGSHHNKRLFIDQIIGFVVLLVISATAYMVIK